MAAICRSTNRSEIAGCSHARFAVAVKSPFDHSSLSRDKITLCKRGVKAEHARKLKTLRPQTPFSIHSSHGT